MKRCLLLTILLATAMSVGAATRTFDVTAHQSPWKFDVLEGGVPVANWNVDKGDHVVIRIHSSDTTHGFRMLPYVTTALELGPTIQTVEFDATTVGDFTYFCTESSCGSGHGSMNGVFKVNATAQPPTISSVSPTSGPAAGGTPVTISGTNFESGATVKFGATSASNVVVTGTTKITCTTPSHAAGAVDVVVTTSGGTATKPSEFTFVPAPTISSVDPASGPTTGGTMVTIAGSGFQNGAAVTFDDASASGTSVKSASEIGTTSPAHAEGAVDVAVTNPDTQSATKSSAFVYATAPEPLTITGISPAAGPPDGGLAFTITGTGFVTGATVAFGGIPATQVEVAGPTTITGSTPAHAAGSVDVVVTNPDSSAATLSNAFTYVTPTRRRHPVRRPDTGSKAGQETETKPN